ncbi:MAG TPA: methyltransferase domain-containing protein, partial [Methylomirabilota bacterium]|nr:methyltransferase domain-containing protein [Methylomirabilota bacterium]
MWRNSAATELAEARELAALLELRARDPAQVSARACYLELVGVTPGSRVLDVGCGSGAVTRDVARRVRPAGRVVGLDPGPGFLAIAAELVEREGLADVVELRLGDARALPFADAEFDVALAVTTLAHVPDGERALPELVRVVRPGGRVGIFDLDGDGAILAHPDRTLTRRIVAASSDHIMVDGWLARRLPALLAASGLEDIGVRAFTPVERDPAGFYARLAERRAAVAVQAGAITVDEQREWLAALRAEQAAGRFLGGQTHLFVWGTRR